MTNLNLALREQRDHIRSVVDSFVTHRGSGRGLPASELILIQEVGELATQILRERMRAD